MTDRPLPLEDGELVEVVVPQETHEPVQKIGIVVHVQHHVVEADHVDEDPAQPVPPEAPSHLANLENVTEQVLAEFHLAVGGFVIDDDRPKVEPRHIVEGLDDRFDVIGAALLVAAGRRQLEPVVVVPGVGNGDLDIPHPGQGQVVGHVIAVHQPAAHPVLEPARLLTLALQPQPGRGQFIPRLLGGQNHRPFGSQVVAGLPQPGFLRFRRRGGDIGHPLRRLADDGAVPLANRHYGLPAP